MGASAKYFTNILEASGVSWMNYLWVTFIQSLFSKLEDFGGKVLMSITKGYVMWEGLWRMNRDLKVDPGCFEMWDLFVKNLIKLRYQLSKIVVEKFKCKKSQENQVPTYPQIVLDVKLLVVEM